MFFRFALLAAALSTPAVQAVKIRYDSPEDTPYCGKEVLKLSVERLFPGAKVATVGSALPLDWSPESILSQEALERALTQSFDAAQSGEFSLLNLSYQSLVSGSQSHSLVLCVVDACARLENGAEIMYLPLPQLRVRRSHIMGVKPKVESRPGEMADRPKRKASAQRKFVERVPKFKRDEGIGAEPGVPSALIASMPFEGTWHSLAWVSSYWAEAARYHLAKKSESFEFDTELAKILYAVVPYAIQAELQHLYFEDPDVEVLKEIRARAWQALNTSLSKKKEKLPQILQKYGITQENLLGRATQLLN